mmetsp:Transcript_52193/g.119031  ORF Transcript_52193/g.119031 Transcript_52193/m.119031 type:complete len:824 (+) Transcript_52193:411-2882(+)
MAGNGESNPLVSDMTDSELLDALVLSVDVFWLLMGAVLVFFMQVGFSMLEVGSVQPKSTKNVLIKNIFDVSVSAVSWSLLGHSLSYGAPFEVDEWGIFFGTTGFALWGGEATARQYAAWLFDWAFVSTAATIVSGAVAERINFFAYVAFTLLLSLVTYPLLVHWTWSEYGFLSASRGSESSDRLLGCGVLDFAGSGVVHLTGGTSALIAIVLLGPRSGVTFKDDGTKLAPPGQSEAFKTLGTLSLWFGWFGFNGCSTGFIVGNSLVAARAVVMTAVAGASSGLLSALINSRLEYGTWSQLRITPTLNGILCGLVSVAANCATVHLEGAIAIGLGSAICYVLCARALERNGIDDVVQAVPVHLSGGLWGLVAAGLFTVPSAYKQSYTAIGAGGDSVECAGLLYGGSGKQLAANLLLGCLDVAWVTLTVGALFLVAHRTRILRVSKLIEQVGLDLMLHNDRPDREGDETDMELTLGHPGGLTELTGGEDTSNHGPSQGNNNSNSAYGQVFVEPLGHMQMGRIVVQDTLLGVGLAGGGSPGSGGVSPGSGSSGGGGMHGMDGQPGNARLQGADSQSTPGGEEVLPEAMDLSGSMTESRPAMDSSYSFRASEMDSSRAFRLPVDPSLMDGSRSARQRMDGSRSARTHGNRSLDNSRSARDSGGPHAGAPAPAAVDLSKLNGLGSQQPPPGSLDLSQSLGQSLGGTVDSWGAQDLGDGGGRQLGSVDLSQAFGGGGGGSLSDPSPLSSNPAVGASAGVDSTAGGGGGVDPRELARSMFAVQDRVGADAGRGGTQAPGQAGQQSKAEAGTTPETQEERGNPMLAAFGGD